jgi:nicotinamidase-related amidase
MGLFLFCSVFHMESMAQSDNQHKSIVLVLDIQSCYTKMLADNTSDEFIQSVNKIIAQTSSENVIYVRTIPKALLVSLKGIKVDTLPGVEFDNRLKVVNSHHFVKKKGDAFATPEILKYLQESGAEEIFIVGLLAEKCVYHTAIGGLKSNFAITIIPRAVAGKSEKSKVNTLKKLSAKGVRILDI